MKNPNVKRNCAVCGTAFARYVEPSRLASGRATGQFCSRKCKGVAQRGNHHPSWAGGRCVVNGYVWVHAPEHPHAKHQGYVLEHRLVMERHLGRRLAAAEVVHHVNGNKQDNRIENLKLFASNAAHLAEEFSITDQDVAELRRMWRAGGWTQRQLGARFGLAPGSVSRIINNRRRKTAALEVM